MKESELIRMKRQIEVLGSITQTLMTELDNLKTLSFGTSQIIKNMPDYEEAIEKLKKESAREHGEGEEVISDGKTGE
jgi:hypothetical protein|tara:strand:+ start:420 stop:650 length:231 start_codon:yes stop_codon:yes gene_type:complete